MTCDWPAFHASPCDALADLPQEDRDRYEEMAADYLRRFTGGRFGLCSATVRPCRQPSPAPSYAPGAVAWQPVLVGGRWLNLGCGGGCGPGDTGTTLVFEAPVHDVVEVTLGGEALAPAAWRLDSGRLLVRQDGGRWPLSQDLSRPLGDPGTWGVTVRVGSPVPQGGQVAAGKLACELARAAAGDKGCELPQRWQTISRQGVSISAALDSFEGLDEGKTGIWVIDSWVASVTRPDQGFSIATPDYHAARRHSGTP
jgi:hypothetical protein